MKGLLGRGIGKPELLPSRTTRNTEVQLIAARGCQMEGNLVLIQTSQLVIAQEVLYLPLITGRERALIDKGLGGENALEVIVPVPLQQHTRVCSVGNAP